MVRDLIWGTPNFISQKLKKFKEEESLPFDTTAAANKTLKISTVVFQRKINEGKMGHRSPHYFPQYYFTFEC